MLRRVMQPMELRSGDPSSDGTEVDAQVHVDPISPHREHRPEPHDGDGLEVEQDRHRQIDDERAEQLLAEMIAMHGRHVDPLFLVVKLMLHPQQAYRVLGAMPPIEEKVEHEKEGKRLQHGAGKSIRKMDGNQMPIMRTQRIEPCGNRWDEQGSQIYKNER